MTKFVIAVLLLMFSIMILAQTTTLQNEILDYPDSKSELISKGRRLLTNKFIEGDIVKVQEIKKYLITDIEDNDYLAFYPIEYWIISIWTEDYSDLLNHLIIFDSFDSSQYQRMIKPENDLLLEKLIKKTRESKEIIEVNIYNSNLTILEKDFLSMFLMYLITDNQYSEITQDMLNSTADDFLSNHPNSRYENIARKHIRNKWIQSKWGLVAEFFSGYGIFTESLESKFHNNIPIGVAFDIYYNKFVLYLRDYIGFSKTKKDILYNNGTWKKGSQVRVFLPEASLGYVVLDNDLMKIAPFTGIASTDISPTENDEDKDPSLEKAALDFTTTYTIGINIDFKLGKSKIPMVTYGPESSYWFLRLRYAYNFPQFENNYDNAKGNMHYLTIGIGGFGSKLKRDY